MPVLITGAAGNMGGLLAKHLLPGGRTLRLMYHRTPLAADLHVTGRSGNRRGRKESITQELCVLSLCGGVTSLRKAG
jgi:NAD(P)-dependent dehydrogenase (short-subunit alcohol dehydrogenase family)